MAEQENEDVMHKREILMEDGKRKLYFFTFGDEAAETAKSDDAGDAKEAGNE